MEWGGDMLCKEDRLGPIMTLCMLVYFSLKNQQYPFMDMVEEIMSAVGGGDKTIPSIPSGISEKRNCAHLLWSCSSLCSYIISQNSKETSIKSATVIEPDCLVLFLNDLKKACTRKRDTGIQTSLDITSLD